MAKMVCATVPMPVLNATALVKAKQKYLWNTTKER